MKFFLPLFVWLVMATFLAWGILLAVKGSLFLLVIAALGFIVLVAKFGCLSH